MGKYILNSILDFSFSPIVGVPTMVTANNITNEIGDRIIAFNSNYREALRINENWHPEQDEIKAAIELTPIENEQEQIEQITNALTKGQILQELQKIKSENTDKKISWEPSWNKESLAKLLYSLKK